MDPPRPRPLPGIVCALLALAPAAFADPRVAVTANARPEYTQQKFPDGKARAETYVFMQGGYFDGVTVDHSIERMPFRRIAEYLGVELARQNYLPARTLPEAQLLIVVHWGTTTPRVTRQEMLGQANLATPMPGAADIAGFARENPTGVVESEFPPPPDTTMTPEANDLPAIADRLIGNVTAGNAASLLGYSNELHRLGKRAWVDTKSDILNYHLGIERYFITLMAYDLRELSRAGRRRPVWTVHLNISSPGNNFTTALDRISPVAATFAGRTTDGMETIRPGERATSVTLAPLIILGEVKDLATPGPDRH